MEEARPGLVLHIHTPISIGDKIGQRTEKCLHFNGKWRHVCLACGLVDIDGVWTSIRWKTPASGTAGLTPQ